MEFAVIVPTHGRPHYLAHAVDSILAQTLPATEIIVVADGADPAVRAVLGERPVTLIEQAQAGVAAARNAGVAASTSRWLCFLDDDDMWHPDRLAATADFLASRPAVAAVHCASWLFGERGTPGIDVAGESLTACLDGLDTAHVTSDWSHLDICGRSFDLLLERNRSNISGASIDRHIFDEAGGFPRGYTCAEDWVLAINVARLTEWHTVPGRLSFLRTHPGNNTTTSSSTNGLMTLHAIAAVWDDTARPTPSHRPLADYGSDYRFLAQQTIWGALRRGDRRTATASMRTAHRLLPRLRDRIYIGIPPQITYRVARAHRQVHGRSMPAGHAIGTTPTGNGTTRSRSVGSAIVYGALVDDTALQWPGRNQLFLAIAERVPVVLLERPSPTRRWLDFRRPALEPIDGRLYVMHNALALRSSRLGKRLPRAAAFVDGRWFRAVLREHALDDWTMWLIEPDPTLALGVDDDQLVYDCMDPNFLSERQAEFDRAEFAVAHRASVVFASARTLYNRMRSVNPETYVLPNAAPIHPFDEQRTGARPTWLPDGPVVGYLGTIDWRFDVRHVLAAASALPAVTFAIVGRVNADQEEKIAPLRSLPNVRFPGQVDAATGDACIAAFDVGIVSFIPNEMNDSINPVKMYMYLAAGLPVVSTWVAECRDNPFVSAARSPDEFASLISQALNEDDPTARAQRRRFAAENTWTQRADSALQILWAHGMLR